MVSLNKESQRSGVAAAYRYIHPFVTLNLFQGPFLGGCGAIGSKANLTPCG